MIKDPRIAQLLALIKAAINPPPGAARITLALIMGLICHATFAIAIMAMISSMFFGLSESFGTVAWPWAGFVNFLLILQFPAIHSILLTKRGRKFLSWLIPGRHGETLATTTYAIIASVQLLALFALWTPLGIAWWRA